jgi:N-acetyl-1-D-myo-inositol-2-amino-2-deoxy-alpha-D-glucopyranoside deacetylase
VRPRLAAVFAHPDDDVYQVGGSIALHDGDLDVTVVVCTSGDAGPIWIPEAATRETLGEVREAEERAALVTVGVAESVLREVRPHVVVTFGPDGLTSHHDHIRAGEAATEAFHLARASSDGRAFARLYRTALPRGDVDRFYAEVARMAEAFGDETQLFNPVGVPDEDIVVRVDTSPVRERKLAGILSHRTQIGEWERIPEPARWLFLDAECFVQAWPSEPGRRVLGDLFEGLDLD